MARYMMGKRDQKLLESDENLDEKIKRLRECLLNGDFDYNNLTKYKRTDFRRERVLKQLGELRKFSYLTKLSVSVQLGPQPKSASAITVDTTKSNSNTDAVRLALKELRWREFPAGKKQGSCHMCWNSTTFADNPNLGNGFVNKFPGILMLLHKVNLSRTLDIMRQLFPDHYGFYPISWYLPHQLNEFTAHVRHTVTNDVATTYIVKPDEGTQGDGIYLIRDPEQYRVGSKNHVVQEYLSNPLLIDGYKFDLRIYVVLRSIQPLEISICKEGLARFCTMPYHRPTNKNLHEVFMHLTNYSLNKKSKTFIHSADEDYGSKRTMSSVFHRLEEDGYDVVKIWEDIEALVCKTVIAFLPELKIFVNAEIPPNKPGPSCFQILGFDVLLLSDLKPILLEVNSNPSLRLDSELELAPGIAEYCLSQVDHNIKKPLVRDTLTLMESLIRQKIGKTKARQAEQGLSVRSSVECMKSESMPLRSISARASNQRFRSQAPDIVEDEEGEAQAESDEGSPAKDLDAIIVENKENIEKCETDKEGTEQETRSNADGDVEMEDIALKEEIRTCHLGIPDDGSNFQSYRNGDVHVTVSGTSPQIREQERQLHVLQTKREKSWLRGRDSRPQTAEDEIEQGPETEDPSQIRYDSEGQVELRGLRKGSYMSLGRIYNPADEKEESCLTEIYPACYKESLCHLRILESTTEIFLAAIGYRSNLKMGSTSFRAFARKCQLGQLGYSSATIDIIYIDLHRRWEYIYPDGGSGLCYQAFLEAFFKVAFAKFARGASKLTAVQRMINHCRKHMGLTSFLETTGKDDFTSWRSDMLEVNPSPIDAQLSSVEKLESFLKKSKWRREVNHYSRPLRSAGFKTGLLPSLSVEPKSLTNRRNKGYFYRPERPQ